MSHSFWMWTTMNAIRTGTQRARPSRFLAEGDSKERPDRGAGGERRSAVSEVLE
jgi:hypothetical protein